jgi:putative FmdB family regulatory protein
MPIYEYRAVGEAKCEACVESFEAFQNYADSPLATCPECGAPVEKLFSTPAVQGAGRTAETLSNKNLAEKGFTKYVKAGKGTYEKVAGKGPKVITK